MTLSQNRTLKDAFGPAQTQSPGGAGWEKKHFQPARLRFLLHTLRLLRHPGVSGALHAFLGRGTKVVVEKNAALRIGASTWIGNYASIIVRENCRLTTGSNFSLNEHSHICCSGKLSVGTDVSVNNHSVIHVHGNAVIGKDVMIGSYVYITDSGHSFLDRDVPIRLQGLVPPTPLSIGDDVWIGTKVTITRGVTIGRGAVIGANSVLSQDVGDYEIWGGVPAKFIRLR